MSEDYVQQRIQEIGYDILRLMEARPGSNKQALIALGELLYPITYAGTDSDEAATNLLSSLIGQVSGELGEKLGETLRKICRNGAVVTTLLGAARWADQAYPQISVGHKYASSMMITSVRDPGVIADIRPPWAAFTVDMPTGLLPVADPTQPNGTATIVRALVRYKQDPTSPNGYAWTINGFTDGSVTFWRVNHTEAMLDEESKYLTPGEHAFALDADDMDKRTMLYVSRLIINLCLSFSDPSAVVPEGLARKRPNMSRPKGSRIEPVVRSFRVGKPVTVDVRDFVKSFLLHGKRHPVPGGRALQVQTLIRGHWKPKLSARVGYPVWIEPHWRGPEEAPILVTPRRVK